MVKSELWQNYGKNVDQNKKWHAGRLIPDTVTLIRIYLTLYGQVRYIILK